MAEKAGGWTPNPGPHGWGDFDSMIATWEAELADRSWILGETFSAADVMLGSNAIFLRTFGLLPLSTILHAYADRCLERGACGKALALEQGEA